MDGAAGSVQIYDAATESAVTALHGDGAKPPMEAETSAGRERGAWPPGRWEKELTITIRGEVI